jgi:shikimate dehydrogenase
MSKIDGETRLVGVIGWPVGHSLSPHLHNAAFAALDLNWTYVPLQVSPSALGEAIRGVVTLGFRGVNVTVPHKQAVIPHLASVSESALAIGAVNTIVVEEDASLSGHNTDWIGFLASLRRNGVKLKGRRVLVIGAGGAARAVVYGLGRSGAEVTVFNRHEARAKALVDDLSGALPDARLESGTTSQDALAETMGQASLLIQSTSVGMWPKEDESVWPDELAYPQHLDVCDLVYRPQITKLMSTARLAGANTISGVGMLVHQAAPAFKMWTGRDAPLGVMWSACMKALGGDS